MLTNAKTPHTHSAVIRVVILALLLFSGSCKFNPTEPSTPPVNTVFTLGTKTTVASQSISSGGGSISVTSGQLSGMTITIPSGAYSESRTFTISTAPITNSTLNSNIQVLTPMISIANGGGYSAQIMSMQIPISLPSGSVAEAFFYNESTGELEPIPVDAESSTSITISTRHFSTSTLTSSNRPSHGIQAQQNTTAFSDIIVLAMDENKLFASGNQVSAFTPGVDDWEFTNYGSYIAPGGHCAGQSLSSMWFFNMEKNVLHQSLNSYLATNAHLLNYPSADRLGYRFASTIQADQSFTNWVQHVSFQALNPALTFKLFLLGVYVSKQPQYLIMYQSKDTGGHAMVCYGVNFTNSSNGQLLIADPNHPGVPEVVNFQGGQFQPYVTGLTADGTPLSFDRFAVLAKTAYVDWEDIGARWAQVQNKTIGSVAPNAFPQVALKYYDPNSSAYVNMPSNVTINSDSIDVAFSVPGSVHGSGEMTAYSTNGTILHWTNGNLILNYGQNIVGFYITATNPNNVNAGSRWVDFIWDTIYSDQLTIDPAKMNGEANVSYTWSASAGYIPNNARYEWDFGDQTPKEVFTNEGSASHTYEQSGIYTITLSLYDNSSNKLVGKATAKATIGGLWDLLHQQNGFRLSFASVYNYSDGSHDSSTWTWPRSFISQWIPITWNDTTFTGSVTMYYTGWSSQTDSEVDVVSGTMLSDGLTIKSLTIYHHAVDNTFWDYAETIPQAIDTRTSSLQITNAIGVENPNPQYLPVYGWLGGVNTMVSNVKDQETTKVYDTYGNLYHTTSRTLTSVGWNQVVDYLEIDFNKQ